jgi:aminopeptidase N
VPGLQGVPQGKLILINDDDLTYCSLRLDPHSLQTVLTRIADIAGPLPCSGLVGNTADTRDAEMRARYFVGLVIGAMHAETDIAVVRELLVTASGALAAYADPGWACTQGWPAYADRLLDLARSADAGSDRQLVCGAVLSPQHRRVCWPSCSTANWPRWGGRPAG